MKGDKHYPGKSNAVIKSGLSPKIFPSLKGVWMKADTSKLINDAKQKNRRAGGLNTYFCVGFSKIWIENPMVSFIDFLIIMV